MSEHTIAVLTSCTSTKQYKPSHELTQKDFADLSADAQGRRIAELSEYTLPAYQMYTGNQHARLIAGIEDLRANGSTVDLHIISAGYGLIGGNQPIVPYECTFSGMTVGEIEAWASYLKIPETTAQLFQQTHYDLVLVLLGDTYLRALQLTDDTVFGSPTLFLCASKSEKFIKGVGEFYKVNLSGAEAKRFHCGLVGLKGELARRLFVRLGEMDGIPGTIFDDVLNFLDDPQLESEYKIAAPMTPLPSVHYTFSVDNLPQGDKNVKYFIPDWDDSVDADYDFIKELHSGGRGNWGNQVYAHQIYERPNYDGLLVSRAVVEKSGAKRATLYLHKVHSFMRVPKDFPIMGDCGAFSYIGQSEPPYQTDEMLDYYTDLGFNLGVSIDHLWFGADTKQDQQYRYDLTIHNAEAFMNEHRKRQLNWTPIGAIQGWDVPTYTNAAIRLSQMGYDYIGLGGMVRAKTKDIISIVESIRSAVSPHVRLHVFGVARPDIIHAYQHLNVTSADSASPLRKAWTDISKGYYTLEKPFAALRIPYVEAYIRIAERRNQHVNATHLRKLEDDALKEVWALDKGNGAVATALEALLAYDTAIRPDGWDMKAKYLETLEAQPWRHCDCAICQEHGVEVVIFRGNNRNRRRGFHNTYIFYTLMQRLLRGEPVSEAWTGKISYQLPLPMPPR